MTAFKSGDPTTLNRLYGRSSGHKLRKGQQELVDRLLPQIEVPAEGEVTAVAGDNIVVVFDGWSGYGDYVTVRDEIETMIEGATIT